MTNHLKTFVVKYILPTISALVVVSVVRLIDTTFFPPVSTFDVVDVKTNADGVAITARMFKPEYRAGCELESLTAVLDESVAIALYKRRDADTFTRPWGWSDVSLRIPTLDFHEAVVTSRHSCYGDAFWWHSTKLAVIKINHVKGSV